MLNSARFPLAVCACLLVCPMLTGQEPRTPRVKYVPKQRDPVVEEMKERNRRTQEQRRAETDRIRDAQAAKPEEREIRFDFAGVEKPQSLAAFQTAFHFPPVRQFNTGDCWCFSTTSFFESEVYRLTGRKVKLSEMFTVYYEFLEEARRYVQKRGASFFDRGSEGNAVMLVWRKYGIVPATAYAGVLAPDGCHDDEAMVAEMRAYMEHIKEHQIYDEQLVLASLRLIMDRYMGRPPERFVHNGVELTPPQFLDEVLKLNLDDYVCVMSTLAHPFHEYAEYEVEANWWHSRDYYNVPLDEFCGILKYAIKNGYTVRLNGDISEPGHNGLEDAAIIPDFDIPRRYIDQDAREFRIFTGDTGDDHDVHLVGWTRVGDYDWFLVKDSYGLAYLGEFKGYFFYREDYIKLKTLTYIVHKDAVRGVIGEFN
jgi:bleomycin hydrolase